MLAKAFNQKIFLLVKQRIVDGGAAQIHSRDDDWHAESP
jgi:hypothetical protein